MSSSVAATPHGGVPAVCPSWPVGWVKRAGAGAPHDQLLAARGELAGEEAREVALQEAEDEDVTHGGEGGNQDDRERHEGQDVARCAPQGLHFPGLERGACAQRGFDSRPSLA